jgi:hypothetical protein
VLKKAEKVKTRVLEKKVETVPTGLYQLSLVSLLYLLDPCFLVEPRVYDLARRTTEVVYVTGRGISAVRGIGDSKFLKNHLGSFSFPASKDMPADTLKKHSDAVSSLLDKSSHALAFAGYAVSGVALKKMEWERSCVGTLTFLKPSVLAKHIAPGTNTMEDERAVFVTHVDDAFAYVLFAVNLTTPFSTSELYPLVARW